jgi:hypothetical protein
VKTHPDARRWIHVHSPFSRCRPNWGDGAGRHRRQIQHASSAAFAPLWSRSALAALLICRADVQVFGVGREGGVARFVMQRRRRRTRGCARRMQRFPSHVAHSGRGSGDESVGGDEVSPAAAAAAPAADRSSAANRCCWLLFLIVAQLLYHMIFQTFQERWKNTPHSCSSCQCFWPFGASFAPFQF